MCKDLTIWISRSLQHKCKHIKIILTLFYVWQELIFIFLCFIVSSRQWKSCLYNIQHLYSSGGIQLLRNLSSSAWTCLCQYINYVPTFKHRFFMVSILGFLLWLFVLENVRYCHDVTSGSRRRGLVRRGAHPAHLSTPNGRALLFFFYAPNAKSYFLSLRSRCILKPILNRNMAKTCSKKITNISTVDTFNVPRPTQVTPP